MGKLAGYWRRITGEQDAVGGHPGSRAASDQRPDASDARQPASVPGISSEDRRRRLESFGLSHVGNVREGNEDHFVIASLQRSLEVRQTNLDDRRLLEPLCGPKAYLFAVADGVGSQAGGGLASGMTLRTIVEYLSETVGSYHAVPAGQEHAFLDPLRQAVQRAHDTLVTTFAVTHGGPATTVTLALLVWPQAFIVHVGDSRAYHVRGSRLQRLTRDQTMGAYLVDTRGMSEQQAEQGGYNNVLASAVGAPDLAPTVSGLTLEQGDILLLCTDGLTKYVSEDEIAAVLQREPNAEASCRELVDLALASGGRDNVTVIVAHTLSS